METDYRAEKRSAAIDFANEKLKLPDVPLVTLQGSLGDKYGYVHSNSDFDIGIWTDSTAYFGRKPAIDWEPYLFKLQRKSDLWVMYSVDGEIKGKKDMMVIDVVGDIKGDHASVAFHGHDKESYELIIKDLAEGNGHNLEYIIDEFVYGEPLRDELGLHPRLKELAEQRFEKERDGLATDVLDATRLFMLKIDDDVAIAEDGGKVDVLNYNKKAKTLIDTATYVRCCIQNIPRSWNWVAIKRNSALWKVLGMDERSLQQTQIRNGSLEDIENSREILKTTMQEVYREAKEAFPELKASSSWSK